MTRTKRTQPWIAIGWKITTRIFIAHATVAKPGSVLRRGYPAGVYMQTVKEDPKRKGLLFAGTELGVFVSFNDGDDWQSLQLNLPPVSMRDLAIHGDDLIVATHGRGFWILDDITALRQINDKVAQSEAFLFQPAGAIRMHAGTDYGVAHAAR